MTRLIVCLLGINISSAQRVFFMTYSRIIGEFFAVLFFTLLFDLLVSVITGVIGC